MNMGFLEATGLAPLPAFLTSLALGLLIGLERERNPASKAGLRTFALVALMGTLASLIAEKIRVALSEPYVLCLAHTGNPETRVEHHSTVSIGVALFANHEASQEDLLKWADTAMYQAKQAGRNTVRFYTASALTDDCAK